jgi:medium-chain acyl-[acyl-carrier-protein] hydrolase
MDAGPVTPWIVRPRPVPGSALRLLCVPYAGAGASVFGTWPAELPAGVEVLAIELPGRETRFKERPFDRLAPLVAQLADAVAPGLSAPFAIYGHSLGALIGFGLARELVRRGRAPAHLFVSGRRAPQLPEASPIHGLPDAELLARLHRLGGFREGVLQERELMELFLPILRADLAVTETAVIAPDDPLTCPITALGGLADDRATAPELEAWRLHTRGAVDREMFSGGHFFLQTARAALLASLSRRLARIAAAP